jgi:putative membrane protein
MLSLSDLPAMNATLNGTSAILLSLGYYFIRQRAVSAHKRCMLGAFVASTLFLISYLVYHYHVGSVRFTGSGGIRTVYFAILISHTILAALIVPLVLVTLWRAWKVRFEKHKRIARWTLPLWLYVSVTGVVIYLMLYHR